MGIRIKVDGVEQSMEFPENRLHNPNNWDPKSYKETYPDAPMGVSGKSVNSDFTRKMDDETKEFLWRIMDENSKLQQKLMMTEHKLVQIKRLMEE